MVRHRTDAARRLTSSTTSGCLCRRWTATAPPQTRPRVLTAHGVLRDGGLRAPPRPGPAPGYSSGWTRSSPCRSIGARAARDRRDRSGARARHPSRRLRLPDAASRTRSRCLTSSPRSTGPVILFFGLIRPYKGVDVLLEAFRSVEGAELWVVGRPLGMSRGRRFSELGRARAGHACASCPASSSDRELPAYFRRADIVVLPHRDAEQSRCPVRRAGLRQADRDERRRAASPRSRAPAPARSCRRGTPRRWPSALTDLLADPEERETLADRRHAAAAGRTPGSSSPPRRWRSTRSSARDGPRRSSSGSPWPCWSTPTSATRRSCGPSLGRAAMGQPRTGDEPLPRVSLIVAAHDEEDVIERKVRRCARARLSPRAGWR